MHVFLIGLLWSYRLALATTTGGCSQLVSEFGAFVDTVDGGGILRLQKRGREAVAYSNGTLQTGSSTPMADNTLVEWASVTKALTSALILKKHVTSSLDISDTAYSFLENSGTLPSSITGVANVATITLEELLLHTSGLAHFWSDPPSLTVDAWYDQLNMTKPTGHAGWSTFSSLPVQRFAFQGIVLPFLESGFYNATKIWTPTEVLSYAHVYDDFTRGVHHYSDTGYIILGLVVEELYGKTLNDAIQEDLFQPLLGSAPQDTFMRYAVTTAGEPYDRSPEGSTRYDRLSHRYFNSVAPINRYDTTMSDTTNFAGNNYISSYYNSADWAGGGVVSTADELGRFWAALMESTASPWVDVKEMLVTSATDANNSYGLGVKFLQGDDDILGHEGDGGGQMWYDIGDEVVITGTNNNNDGSADMSAFISARVDMIIACASEQPALPTTTTTTTTDGTTAANNDDDLIDRASYAGPSILSTLALAGLAGLRA